MRFLTLMRKGLTAYSNNLTTFVLAMICAAVGSILVLTAPPLLFGLYYMGYRVAKSGTTDLTDLPYGFRFIRKSWVFIIVFFLMISSVPFVSYLMVKRLAVPAALSVLIVFLVFVCWTTLNLFFLVYAITFILGENMGVVEGIRASVILACKRFTTTVSLFISLTLITVLIGWIPVFGPLVVIPYQIITYSKATRELAGQIKSSNSLSRPIT